MLQVIDVGDHGIAVDNWDRFVSDSFAPLTQSAAWARTKGSSYTNEILRGGRASDSHWGQLLQRRTVAGPVGVGYVAGGPVYNEASLAAADDAVEQLIRHARKQRLAAVFVQPMRGDKWTQASMLAQGFRKSTLQIGPSATVVVDLEPPLDELFANVQKSRRRAIRNSVKSGVLVRKADGGDLAQFAKLHALSAKNGRFQAQPAQVIERMWQELSPSGQIHLFVAEFEGEMLAADLLVSDGRRLLDKLTGWRADAATRSLNPNAVLNWELIKWAKQAGFDEFDFGGLRPEIADLMLNQGASRGDFVDSPDYLKLSFGGDPAFLSSTFVYSPLPGAAQVLNRLGSRANAPGRVNRWLNRLRN